MLILLTGGSACGKSTYGEQTAMQLGSPRYYIATMQPDGPDATRRIARHRAMRANRGFQTMERYTDLAGLVLPEPHSVALLECICNLTANEMFSPHGAGPAAEEAVLAGVEALSRHCRHLLVVTNEVGCDGTAYLPETMAYVAALGRINQTLASWAHHVWELVCGIPLVRKGTLL